MMLLAVSYARVYGFFKDRFHVNLRGLGFLLRRTRRETTLRLRNGALLHFNPRVATCYDRLIAGDYNEPETHAFLEWLLPRSPPGSQFVDVGANIGAMLISSAVKGNVSSAVGFEPNPECVRTIQRSAALNRLSNVRVVQAVVAESVRAVTWDASETANAGHLVSGAAPGESLTSTTVDIELADFTGPSIMLIDVEGAEPLVVRGAIEYIRRNQPLIILEYNSLSKRHWRMPEMQALLGERYVIQRLHRGGVLDSDVEHAWNCVAVHLDSPFANIGSERRAAA